MHLDRDAMAHGCGKGQGIRQELVSTQQLIPKGHGCERFVPGALGKGLTEIEVQVASQEAAGEEAHL